MCVCRLGTCIAGAPGNDGNDLVDLQRLGQMGIHPGFQALPGVLCESVGCHGDDRDGPGVETSKSADLPGGGCLLYTSRCV